MNDLNVEHWWNYTDGGKPEYFEKKLFQWPPVHHKFHMDWPGTELGPPLLRPATNGLNNDVAHTNLFGEF
jgi:hypothetical protein